MELQQREKCEQFVAEAHGCIPCTVEMEKLDANAIESISLGLKVTQSKPILDESGN